MICQGLVKSGKLTAITLFFPGETMKILGISCSPRANGNTEIMVREALSKAEEEGAQTELVALAQKNIAPCDACLSCRETGKCHKKDDMQDIYVKLLETDGVIFGSPVFYWTVTAQAKALIDRTFVFSKDYKLEGKAAGAVSYTHLTLPTN